MFTATLALIEIQNLVLLGEKKDGRFKGLVNGPGGVQEPGESLVDCLVRETWEEFKILLDKDSLQHVAVLDCYTGDELDFRVHVYWTNGFIGFPEETESMKPMWAFRNELPYAQMHEADPFWMPRALARVQFNANMYYREQGKGYLGIEFHPFNPAI